MGQNSLEEEGIGVDLQSLEREERVQKWGGENEKGVVEFRGERQMQEKGSKGLERRGGSEKKVN